MWIIRGLKKGIVTTKFPFEISKDEEELVNLGEVEVKKTLPFKKSIHVFFVDAGSCNSCNREVEMMGNPYYDFHRLGIFFTPTPRHADVMLVVGCSESMRDAVAKAYEAMPSPKIIIAVGDCAIDFCKKADVLVRGCPPSPYKIIESILKACSKEVKS